MWLFACLAGGRQKKWVTEYDDKGEAVDKEVWVEEDGTVVPVAAPVAAQPLNAIQPPVGGGADAPNGGAGTGAAAARGSGGAAPAKAKPAPPAAKVGEGWEQRESENGGGGSSMLPGPAPASTSSCMCACRVKGFSKEHACI